MTRKKKNVDLYMPMLLTTIMMIIITQKVGDDNDDMLLPSLIPFLSSTRRSMWLLTIFCVSVVENEKLKMIFILYLKYLAFAGNLINASHHWTRYLIVSFQIQVSLMKHYAPHEKTKVLKGPLFVASNRKLSLRRKQKVFIKRYCRSLLNKEFVVNFIFILLAFSLVFTVIFNLFLF